MLPKVYTALMNDPVVTALIGNRAYRHGMAQQTVQAPYVTWSAPGGDTELVLDTVTDADTFRLNVDVWDNDDKRVEVVAEAVRNCLEQHAVLIAYTADGRDADTQKFRMGFAFDWIISREQ